MNDRLVPVTNALKAHVVRAILILAAGAQMAFAQVLSLDDAVAQNSGIDSGLRGYGVPPSYDWSDNGWPARGMSPAPSGFTAITGWGHVYPQAGMPNVPCKVYVKGLQTYVHKISGGWSRVQEQMTHPSALGQFSADVRTGSSATNTRLADGTEIMNSPANGFMIHWWPSPRGMYPAGTVNGAFTLFMLKTDTANCHLVASAGIDYWRDANAPFLADFSNHPGAAVSSWVKLSTTYKYFYATNFTHAQLLADPPPPLIGSRARPPAPAPAPAASGMNEARLLAP